MKSNSNANSLFPFEAALGFAGFGISVFPELDGSSEGFSLMLFLLQKILDRSGYRLRFIQMQVVTTGKDPMIQVFHIPKPGAK
mgnify:CR=1 FL=1